MDSKQGSSTKALHSKFRSIIRLTEFISAVNKGGYPALKFSDDRSKKSRQRTLNDVLHAIADILVRDREAVAVAVSGSNIVAMEGQTVEATSELGSVDIELADAADREVLGFAADDGTIAEVVDLSCLGISSISAVINAEATYGKAYEFPESSYCMLIGAGESYLPEKLLPAGDLYQHFIRSIKTSHFRTISAQWRIFSDGTDGY
ncbi:hypothetical protein PILCRDRAFT_255107 [Piloderma croceum F 1598]|uniref:Uncharacterized protein n=1 Tax=Piloderma croceum (strain F 1598) TaxID=765440 RepID=A0A0C3FVA1_PILCF|nr:hypothetical protein PILCRDRAFT_255107 [Piloderma croceum F 1598]